MKFNPHNYQAFCIDAICKQKEIGLFLDMGLGKTVTTLTAIHDLIYDQFEIERALVVAPKRVAENTWPDEIEKWEHLQHLKMSLIAGNPKQRLAALKEKADVYVVSRDNLAWLSNQNVPQFDMLVLDELSSFKNRSSQRFKACRKLRLHAKRVVGLTGTPAPNGYLDLWAQIYLLDMGKRLGRTITSFRNEYFHSFFRGTYTEYEIREGSREKIDSRLQDLCISMKAKDYLDLKEPIKIDVKVQLDAKEKKLYKEMERDAVLSLDDEVITAANAAAVSNKLLQLANGAIYDADGNYTKIHDKKLDTLEELIEEAQGQPIIVTYSFKSDLERLMERFPQARKLETKEDIADWNTKKIPLLLAHPASFGHGLNLQDGGSILIWFGLTWSLELYMQTNARLHRQGQKEAVRIYHLIAEGTIDERAKEVIEGKKVRQEELMAQLKAEIRDER